MLTREALVLAVQVAWPTGALVHPVTRYFSHREDGSWPDQPEEHHAGGVHVWGRAAWRVLGGYDERFVGWGGGHDVSALWAAVTFSLYRETPGDAFHLWHERWPASEAEWVKGVEDWVDFATVLGDDAPPGYGDNGPRPMSPLAARYYAARDDTVAMRALLCERFA
jgi:hypothetical protein